MPDPSPKPPPWPGNCIGYVFVLGFISAPLLFWIPSLFGVTVPWWVWVVDIGVFLALLAVAVLVSRPRKRRW